MAYFVSLMCSVNDSNIITLAMIMMTYVLSIFAVAEHLLAQHNAVKMLHGRIRIILDYIKAVEAGMHWVTGHA